jgi:hypothetical protein
VRVVASVAFSFSSCTVVMKRALLVLSTTT